VRRPGGVSASRGLGLDPVIRGGSSAGHRGLPASIPYPSARGANRLARVAPIEYNSSSDQSDPRNGGSLVPSRSDGSRPWRLTSLELVAQSRWGKVHGSFRNRAIGSAGGMPSVRIESRLVHPPDHIVGTTGVSYLSREGWGRSSHGPLPAAPQPRPALCRHGIQLDERPSGSSRAFFRCRSRDGTTRPRALPRAADPTGMRSRNVLALR
jgi:hypothetical protein